MTAYIAGYARTPFAKFIGQLATEAAVDLGAHAVSAALERAGVSPIQVCRTYDHVLINGSAELGEQTP